MAASSSTTSPRKQAVSLRHIAEEVGVSVSLVSKVLSGRLGTSGANAEKIRAIRSASRRLVTIGACATAGGIQALRNYADIAEFRAVVYARPDYIDALATSTPISAHVPVDFELRGCPIDRGQLVEVITAYLAGRRPDVPDHSVCLSLIHI